MPVLNCYKKSILVLQRHIHHDATPEDSLSPCVVEPLSQLGAIYRAHFDLDCAQQRTRDLRNESGQSERTSHLSNLYRYIRYRWSVQVGLCNICISFF
jgi:hypothetical protein